jgi:nucleotide-binding universal stress UspA family protein
MFKKILIPLDRSLLAERVFSQLHWLAPVDTTEILLVSVVEPWNYYGSVEYIPPDWVASFHAQVLKYLEGQRAQLRQLGYTVSIQISEGDSAEVILELAKEESIDLIAMSTHGRSGFIYWALGSVAERVIQGTTVPVFLVREHTPVSVGQGMRILVPLDGSELAEQALPQAQEIAMGTGATILLLRVLETPTEEDMSMPFESKAAMIEMMAQWQAEAELYLDVVAKKVRTCGQGVETRVVSGEPDKMINDVATHESINLIVMNTHGRSGFSRWVYGSTANKVLRTVNCPLILVRATRPKKGDILKIESIPSTLFDQPVNYSSSG